MVDVIAVGALLARALPYLSHAADHVAKKAGEAIGDTAWEFAQRVWTKVGARLRERPAAQEALDEVAASPQDEGARFVLERQLAKVFEADPALADEVEAIMLEAAAAGVVQGDGPGRPQHHGLPFTDQQQHVHRRRRQHGRLGVTRGHQRRHPQR